VEALKDELTKKLKKYIIDPTVSVRFANYRVTVLGEVNKPGEYLIPDGKTTLLGALGLAGDLTIYGKRDNILVVREQDGVRTQAYINLTDANFINSPYYHLKQNDVVYVTPNNAKKNSASFGPQTTIYISIASIIVTILALVLK
jgi:polysaccharide export outer membrane protein